MMSNAPVNPERIPPATVAVDEPHVSASNQQPSYEVAARDLDDDAQTMEAPRLVADTSRQTIVDDALAIAGLRISMALSSGSQALHQEVVDTSAVPPLSEEQHQLLGEWLPRLDRFERQVITLATYHGMPPRQIAPLLDCNTEDVESAMLSATAQHAQLIELDTGEPFHYRAAQRLFTNLGMPQYETELSRSPFAAALWLPRHQNSKSTEGFSGDIRITGLRFGIGRIAVHTKPEQPTAKAMRCAILASLGMANGEIGSVLYVTEDTVKAHLRNIFRNFSIAARSELAGVFLRDGTYSIESEGRPMRITRRELEVAHGVCEGKTNHAIGAGLVLSEETIKTYLRRLSARNGLVSREQIALAAYLSGQIPTTQTSE